MSVITLPHTPKWIESLQGISKPFTRLNPEFFHNFFAKRVVDVLEQNPKYIEKLTEAFHFNGNLGTRIGGRIIGGKDSGGIFVKNPIGIAAGLIKEPHGLKFWEALGPGFITIGGITEKAQDGNLKPRIFRFDKDNAIVNGMGLPGPGLDKVILMLEARKKDGMMPSIPLIANLCNSANTLEEDKAREYITLMKGLAPYVDGFEINISCPNQYNVSGIQTQEEKLRKLIQEVIDFRRILSTDDKRHLILVKVASNLNKTTIDMITKVCNEVECNSIEDDTERKFSKVDIITATNTSTEHNYRRKDGNYLIETQSGKRIEGGMSGEPLFKETLRTIHEFRNSGFNNVMGCGGIGYNLDIDLLDLEDNIASDVRNIKKEGVCGMEVLSSLINGPHGLGTILRLQQDLARYYKEAGIKSHYYE